MVYFCCAIHKKWLSKIICHIFPSIILLFLDLPNIARVLMELTLKNEIIFINFRRWLSRKLFWQLSVLDRDDMHVRQGNWFHTVLSPWHWPRWRHIRHIEGILPKGPYLPCVSMAGRALLAGYHRYYNFVNIDTMFGLLLGGTWTSVALPPNVVIRYSHEGSFTGNCQDIRLPNWA